jgi:hypothetical protein
MRRDIFMQEIEESVEYARHANTQALGPLSVSCSKVQNTPLTADYAGVSASFRSPKPTQIYLCRLMFGSCFFERCLKTRSYMLSTGVTSRRTCGSFSNCSRLSAAFKSRSITNPQHSQWYSRSAKLISVFTCPHCEQRLVDG